MLSVSLQCGLFICLSGITCVGAFISLRGTINKRRWKGEGNMSKRGRAAAALPVKHFWEQKPWALSCPWGGQAPGPLHVVHLGCSELWPFLTGCHWHIWLWDELVVPGRGRGEWPEGGGAQLPPHCALWPCLHRWHQAICNLYIWIWKKEVLT